MRDYVFVYRHIYFTLGQVFILNGAEYMIIMMVFNIFYDVSLNKNNCYGTWMGLVIVFRLYKGLLIWVGIVFLMNVL